MRQHHYSVFANKIGFGIYPYKFKPFVTNVAVLLNNFQVS